MKLSIEVDSGQVDDFIEEITQSSDLFRMDCCGYWLRGVEHGEYGWLAFDDEGGHDQVDELALHRLIAGEELPKGYFKLDRELAIKAWKEGAKRWGVNWFHDRDATAWDYSLQMAIFGEVVYG